MTAAPEVQAPAPGTLWIEYRPLSEVVRWPRNPKGHDIPGIRSSINQFGLVEPPALDERSGRLVVGHGRLESLEADKAEGKSAPLNVQLRDSDGEWMIPIVRGNYFRSDAEAAAYVVASNHWTIAGGWTDELPSFLHEIRAAGVDLAPVGYTSEQIDELLKDCIPAPPPPPPDDDDGGAYREQYAVVVLCTDEAEQQRVYEELTAAGYTCKVVST
ncbi:MAG TPA: hypothetical protein VFR37_05495 [Longimicrobium sp.]|nr:hypothetical protein [Longimicrobium sp.]